MLDMHSEAWWIKALDGELNPAEQVLWERHLVECQNCRVEWAALAQLDAMLCAAPRPVPPADFVAKTVARTLVEHRQRRLWMLLGVSLLTLLLGAGIVWGLSAAYSDFNRLLAAVIFSWDVLAQAFTHTALSLMLTGRAVAPLVLLGALGLLLAFMPNGILATVAVVILRQSRSAERA